MMVTVIPVVAGELGKEPGKVENRRTNRNHPNNNIDKIGQNPEKNPGELRRLAVDQTPVKVHQLTPV